MKNTETDTEHKPRPKSIRFLTAIFGSFLSLSIFSVLILKWVPPPTTSFILQRQFQASLNEEPLEIKYEWTNWENISPYLKVAAVTSEDQRFAEHWGLDLKAIQDAYDEYQGGESLRGASTITQQVAKNLFLWPGQSFIRKGVEAYFSLLIELFWSKKRILEVYLNIVEFGNGVYGAKAASTTYFNTDPENLDMMQSALMVTALPSPRRYNLASPSSYMISRRNWILQYMFYLGNTNYLKKLE